MILRTASFAAVIAVAAAAGVPDLEPRTDVLLGPDGCEIGFDCSNDPEDVVLADFDGDGDLDAATANGGSDDVTVLLNDGDGGLTASATLAAGGEPAGIAAADFDADGAVDLLVANRVAGTLSIFLGNGDGTFGAAGEVGTGLLFLEDVVVADFDGDGAADYATSDLFGDAVAVGLGNGDGTFADAVATAVAPGPSGLAVGDFDGDGRADLAVTLDDALPGEVAILLGDGAGNFAVQTPPLAAGDGPLNVAVGDLDGDGNQDLAVPNWGEDTVSVFYGNGDGSFSAGPVLDAGLVPEDAAIADLDGDGIADIVTLDGFGSESADGLLIVIPGAGGRDFDAIAAFDLGAGPSSVAVGDLDGDGDLDVVTTHFDSDDLAVTLNGAASDCVGDCNGDGMVSIAELITGVNIALGNRPAGDCDAIDRDSSGTVSIAELIAAVNRALLGCTA
jgi:hypothetical protein